MTPERAREITSRYQALRIAVLGDFCLDRYLEIDPALEETSIETGRTVHNVVRTRAQPGGAGTILNNLAALGIGTVHAIGFRGDDGEGYELARALRALPGVNLERLVRTTARRTFTYCKPLLVAPGRPPVELDRIDTKNFTPTPPGLARRIAGALRALSPEIDALVVLDQVDRPGTGVVTGPVRDALGECARDRPSLTIVADSRAGLRGFPPAIYKMNAAELGRFMGADAAPGKDIAPVREAATRLARENGRPVVVTLAERGMLGAAPDGGWHHVPAFPVRGPIDIVGAGDAVSANLACAFAAGASLPEALLLANAAASVVLHQLGTTGAASVDRILARIFHTGAGA